MTYFTDTERATLLHLYPDADSWWGYFYVLSDAVSERDEVAGEFVRWLCAIRQRPFHETLETPPHYRWWHTHPRYDWKLWHGGRDTFQNYLPSDFDAWACDNTSTGLPHSDSDPVRLIEKTVYTWTLLTPDRRQELWREIEQGQETVR